MLVESNHHEFWGNTVHKMTQILCLCAYDQALCTALSQKKMHEKAYQGDIK